MTTKPVASSQQSVASGDRAAAIRHAVYRDLLDYLPVASYDQARQFVVNLGISGAERAAVPTGPGDGAVRERILNAALMRFLTLRVTPDIGETGTTGCFQIKSVKRYADLVPPKWVSATKENLEVFFNVKYGDHLAHVPGFYRRHDAATFRLNLPENCAAYGYGMHYGPSRISPMFYTGLLFSPLDRLNSYFLLSSSKYGGPKAIRLTPRDQQYFTQFEEVTI